MDLTSQHCLCCRRLSMLSWYYDFRLLVSLFNPCSRSQLTASFSPVEAYFAWPSPGVCINELYADTILSGFNTLSEALIAALPIPVLFQLRMKPDQQWAVLILLCLGFLVAVVGSVRTYYVWLLFSNDDLTWYAGPHWICSEVEICVAMVSTTLSDVSSAC